MMFPWMTLPSWYMYVHRFRYLLLFSSLKHKLFVYNQRSCYVSLQLFNSLKFGEKDRGIGCKLWWEYSHISSVTIVEFTTLMRTILHVNKIQRSDPPAIDLSKAISSRFLINIHIICLDPLEILSHFLCISCKPVKITKMHLVNIPSGYSCNLLDSINITYA